MDLDWTAIRLTLLVAACTTGILLVAGLPLAAWLARPQRGWRFLVEVVVALPLVLPPTVLGFYILWATGPRSVFGRWYEALFDSRIPFTFSGVVLASVLYNLPFAVRPFTAALAAVDRRLIEASWCLGVSRVATFRRITLPLAWRGILAGLVLVFAHAVGEFGVVLMVGGNIPGVTRTLSVAIYDDVQALDYAAAGRSSLFLLAFAFGMLSLLHVLQRGDRPR
ncbi:MAG: molybdate ABC transporter permease subunit [Planctomycetia bacterium]|nr:molybdate ABC transporter permease subunit [Planctomycetia bacterium]